MSQNIRAVVPASVQGNNSKVDGSGLARTSDSWIRLNPSMADPSKCTPSLKAFSSSIGDMATDLSWPTTSVNQSLISLTFRSSTARSTYSIWRSFIVAAPVVVPRMVAPSIDILRLLTPPAINCHGVDRPGSTIHTALTLSICMSAAQPIKCLDRVRLDTDNVVFRCWNPVGPIPERPVRRPGFKIPRIRTGIRT